MRCLWIIITLACVRVSLTSAAQDSQKDAGQVVTNHQHDSVILEALDAEGYLKGIYGVVESYYTRKQKKEGGYSEQDWSCGRINYTTVVFLRKYGLVVCGKIQLFKWQVVAVVVGARAGHFAVRTRHGGCVLDWQGAHKMERSTQPPRKIYKDDKHKLVDFYLSEADGGVYITDSFLEVFRTPSSVLGLEEWEQQRYAATARIVNGAYILNPSKLGASVVLETEGAHYHYFEDDLFQDLIERFHGNDKLVEYRTRVQEFTPKDSSDYDVREARLRELLKWDPHASPKVPSKDPEAATTC